MNRPNRPLLTLTLVALLLAFGTDDVRADGDTANDARKGMHPDTVVAYVNDKPILFREILLELGPALERLGNPSQREEIIEKEILSRLQARLILAAAKEAQILVDKKLIDADFDRRRERIEADGHNLEDYLDEQGLDIGDLRKMLEEDFKINAWMTGQLGLRRARSNKDRPRYDPSVGPLEAKIWFNRNKERFKQPADVTMRTILISVSSFLRIDVTTDQAVAEARALSEKVKAKLAAGEDFSALAREYSQDPFKKDGGRNPRKELRSFLPGLRETVAATPVGGVGDFVIRQRARSGREMMVHHFLIFQIDERRDDRFPSWGDPEVQKTVFTELRRGRFRLTQTKILLRLAKSAVISPLRLKKELIGQLERAIRGK